MNANRAEIIEKLAQRSRMSATNIRPYARDAGASLLQRPASSAQQRLWFLDRLEGSSAAYHLPIALRLRGNLDRSALRAALDALVARHEALRTTFADVGGEPMQHIAREGRFELRELSLGDAAALLGTLESIASEPFDLAQGPLVRGALIDLPAAEHVLLIDMHHIISDGWSIGVLMNELGRFYRGEVLAPLTLQYSDYALWQRKWLSLPEQQSGLRFWSKHLAGAPELLELPTDRPRSPAMSRAGAIARFSLGPICTAQLRAFARDHEVTLAMVLFSAFAVALSRLSNQPDLVIGMPVANRTRTELEPLIGFFVNTLPLRVSLDDDPCVDQLLRRVKSLMLDAYTHQNVPFERIVEAVRPARSRSHSPLFQVMFALQNAPTDLLSLPALEVSEQDVPLRTAKFDLSLSLLESSDDVTGFISYACGLFDSVTVERFATCFRTITRALLADPASPVSRLRLVDEAERNRVLAFSEGERLLYPVDRLMHQLVEDHAARQPEAIAVISAGRQLSYAQLNQRANQLARELIARGVRPDARVAVCLTRSTELIVALLGVLKAGGAYVPLDPAYPAERLEYMLKESRPVVLLTEERTQRQFRNATVPALVLDAAQELLQARAVHNVDVRESGVQPGHLAYVIYTSGSTGLPKGVAIEHANLVSMVTWHCRRFGIFPGRRSSCLASIAFDATVFEIWPALCGGATLLLASSEVIEDPEKLLLWWSGTPLDVSVLLTPMAEFAFSRNLRNDTLRELIIGGDRLRTRPPQSWVKLINAYGPTECTVLATSGEVYDEDAVIHIGRPIANSRIYILDQHLQPVPIGVTGEIFIGGAGVGRGYLHRPELTAERFLPDPFRADARARMYKTGDLARWRIDGTVEYVGRNDQQVKIRGFRIELGEIEVQLARHPQVRDAIVIAREDEPGRQRLVAYLTSRGDSPPENDSLRSHLRKTLPEYMVPSAFVVMEALPLTPNGKLDRRALPAPAGSEARVDFEAPQGATEEAIAGVWREVLGDVKVDRRDHFFELGGHSLLATRVISRIRELRKVELPLRALFDSPTLQEFATRVAEAEQNVVLRLRERIGKMQADSVLARIAELEKELGSDAKSG